MNTGKSGGPLDLVEVDTDNEAELVNRIENYYKDDSSAKSQLSKNWERNHLMLDGQQWLVYDGNSETGGLWKKLSVSKANEFIPRPVTNYIFDAFQTLKSYLIKNKPRSSVKPNTLHYRDKSAAKIADLILETNWERLKEEQNYEYAAACGVLYGTVFKKSYWDTTTVSMVKVPRMVQKPKTDPNTGMVIGMEEVQDVDPMTGELVFDMLPLGDVNTDVVEPHRIALDPEANDLHKARWIMEYSIQPIEWIMENYGKSEPGYTGKAETVKPETNLSGSIGRFHKLKNSSGIKSSTTSIDSQGDDQNIGRAAVVKEYYERPTIKYPKGRLVVVANSVCLYKGDSPCEGPDMGDWHPYSEFRWEIVPGRFFGKSPIDPAVEIQKQINSIDAVIILTRKTMAIPQKKIPIGSGVSPGQWTGRPGQEIFYRADGGPGPEIIPAMGVDAQVFKEREQKVSDFKTVTGAIDILKGDRPPGVTAASALNLLYEVGTGKLFPALDRWKKFTESDQKKQLKVISKNYKEPRKEFSNMLMAKNSELSEAAINNFIGADLYDNCNVVVEAGSNIPKLQAAKQAMLQEAAQIPGLLGLERPENRMEFQKQLGIVGFDNDVGPDQKRAEWENDLLENIEHSPDNVPIVLYVDNDEIHMNVLANRMKEPSFVSLSAAVQQAFMSHYQEHQSQKMQKEQALMMEQMQMGAMGMDPVQQGTQQPQAMAGGGGGTSKEVRNALNSDVTQGVVGGS